MVNILLLKQNGSIDTVAINDDIKKKEDIKFSTYSKHPVKFIHKWKLSSILNNVNSDNKDLSLNIYAKSKFKQGLDINKHDLPPPLNNLENVYYGNIIIVGLDNDDNIINFDKEHWKSLVKLLNKEDDDDEDDDEENDEEDEETVTSDDDFIVNSSDSDIYEDLEEEENCEEDMIKEYEQIIGKQTVTIFRLKRKIKELEANTNK